MLNVSHENDLIFMRMNNVQVTYIFIPIVSHKDSFCHRGKSKLGIGLFIHELLREPLIYLVTFQFPFCNLITTMQNICKTKNNKAEADIKLNFKFYMNWSKKACKIRSNRLSHQTLL